MNTILKKTKNKHMDSNVTISDLPLEILLKIFKNLRQKDLFENCLHTSCKWRHIIAVFFISPYLTSRINIDKDLKNLYEKEGWFEGCEDSDLIIQLYEKSTKSKVLVATGYPYENGKYVEVIDMLENDTKVKCQSDPNALCSRNFQNVKLRLDIVEI